MAKRQPKDPFWAFLPEKKRPKPRSSLVKEPKIKVDDSNGLQIHRVFVIPSDSYWGTDETEQLVNCSLDEYILDWACHKESYLTIRCVEGKKHVPMIDCDSEEAMQKATAKLDKQEIRYFLFQSSPNKFWAFVDLPCATFTDAADVVARLTDKKHLDLCRRRGAFYVRGMPKQGFTPGPIKDSNPGGGESPVQNFAKKLTIHFTDPRVDLLGTIEKTGYDMPRHIRDRLSQTLVELAAARAPVGKTLASVRLSGGDDIWDDL